MEDKAATAIERLKRRIRRPGETTNPGRRLQGGIPWKFGDEGFCWRK